MKQKLIAISPDRENGKLLVMSSITGEFFYEADFFSQPSDIFLLNDRNYIIYQDFRQTEKKVELIIKLYYQGKLTDSIIETQKFKNYLSGNLDSDIYYLDSLGTRLKFCDHFYTIDNSSHRFFQTDAINGSFESVFDVNILYRHIQQTDELMLDGVPYEKWVTDQNLFENEIHLKINICVIDGHVHCTLQNMYSVISDPKAALLELQKRLEKAVISDSFNLERTHAWYFEKTILLNHQKE